MSQCGQSVTMWPNCHNAAKVSQCDQNFPVQWLLKRLLLLNLSAVFPTTFQQLVLHLGQQLVRHTVFLETPFLLLLVHTLCIETGLLLWVAFNFFVLLPAAWVLTGSVLTLSESVLLQWFYEISSFLPLICYTMISHMNKQNNNEIIVKQYCPCSFFHDSSRSVSRTHDLLWDRPDNVLRVNLTLTPMMTCIERSLHMRMGIV